MSAYLAMPLLARNDTSAQRQPQATGHLGEFLGGIDSRDVRHCMPLLTVGETAELLKTSKQQVRKMIRQGLIPAMKVGREYRVMESYLTDFLESNMT